MTKYWTGIGSRKVSDEIAKLQMQIGRDMASLGYVLLSGGAEGSDNNFHKGVCEVDPTLAEIWIPWNGFMKEIRPSNKSDYIIPDKYDNDIARDYYLTKEIIPWFDNMKQGAQKLHARNYFQIFSDNTGSSPASSVVIYAAPENNNGEIKGGTRSAVMIAREEGLPTYNLAINYQKDNILKIINKKKDKLKCYT